MSGKDHDHKDRGDYKAHGGHKDHMPRDNRACDCARESDLDPRSRNLIGHPQSKPCSVCGARPERRSRQVGLLEISLLVYPCDCYDRLHKEKEEKEHWEKMLQASRIPPRYYHAQLLPSGISPHEKVMIPWCNNFIDHFLSTPFTGCEQSGRQAGRGFGLIGDVGVGKTYYICAVLLSLMRKGKKCLFWSVPEYYKALKSSFSNLSKDSDKYDALINETKETEIVALDDIGAEYGTQWTVDELADVINYRYNHLLTTLWTSNLRVDELMERIGKRTVDRLREMGCLKMIEGKSIRGKSGREKE
ncbi:MAG: ATP-binding protein [bacterium]